MSLLVYSDKCKHSLDTIRFIQQNPVLQSMVKLHDVKNGVPKRVTRVPSLLTSDGQVLIGGEVKSWLESMIPSTFSEYDSCSLGMSTIDNSDTDTNFFSIDMYGQSLQPAMTRQLEEKINKKIEDAMNDIKN